MSLSPTRQLGKLSLGENMPTTRSQAQRSRQRRRRRRLRSPPSLIPDPPASTHALDVVRRRHSHRTSQRLEERRLGRDRKGNHDHYKDFRNERTEPNIEIEPGRQPNDDEEVEEEGGGEVYGDDEEEEEEEEEEDTNPNAMNPMIVAAKSKIVYDTEGLSLESRARALAGLTARFDVVYCKENARCYEFQLIERPRIRICHEGAECTCSEYRSRPDIACRHIFWLVDQIYDSISPHTPPPGLPLSRDGFSPTLPPVHTLLRDRLEAFANHVEWPFVPENDRLAWTTSGESIAEGLSRQEQVRDIMSAFNKMTLPEDFRRDLVESTASSDPRTPEQCVVQGDLEATIFRLAVHDDGVFSSLRKAMPAGACAAIYFDKVQQKSRALLTQFDEYRRTGRVPSGVVRSDDAGRSLLDNVSEVAKELRRHVAQIRSNLASRIPYGAKGAAEALITLLQEISARNVDAFENNSWGRLAPSGEEDDDDRNLYEQLIGQAGNEDHSKRGGENSSGRRGGEDEGGLFILDVLEEVPAALLEPYITNLRDILAKVEVIPAPASFLRKLKSLIHEAQSSHVQSRGKRPATADAGGSQKRTR